MENLPLYSPRRLYWYIMLDVAVRYFFFLCFFSFLMSTHTHLRHFLIRRRWKYSWVFCIQLELGRENRGEEERGNELKLMLGTVSLGTLLILGAAHKFKLRHSKCNGPFVSRQLSEDARWWWGWGDDDEEMTMCALCNAGQSLH